MAQDEYSIWDDLVHSSPQGTIFHNSKWIITSSELSRKKGMIYGYFKNNLLIGGCLVYSYKKFNFLSIANSTAPLSPYGGFIFAPFESSNVHKNENIRGEIISKINSEMMKTFDFISLVNSPELLDIRPFICEGWKERVYYDYVLCLNNDIFLNMSKSVRTSIRKAQKIGITVKKEYNPNIFWKLNEKTYEKQNMKIPIQKEYLLKLMDILYQNNLGEMWIAKTSSDEPASAKFSAFDSHGVQGLLGANDPMYKNSGVNSFLHFEMFKDYQKRGFQWYNLMAAEIPHLAEFYSKYNPKLVPYYKVEKMSKKYFFLKTLWSLIR